MADKLLIMGCSKTKVRSDELLPAYKLYDDPYWRMFRRIMPTLTTRPRVLVLSARYGLIKPTTLLPYYDQRWTATSWRKDVDWIKVQYNWLLQPQLRPNLDIRAVMGVPYRLVLEACGIIDDVVAVGAVYRAPVVGIGIGTGQLRDWLLEGQNDA